MKIRVRMDLSFNTTQQAQVNKLRDALLPFIKNAKVINVGSINEERGFIDVENCGHDEGKPCEKLDRWEVGKGKVFPKE